MHVLERPQMVLAGQSLPGGESSVVVGSAVLTVPFGSFWHTESVAAAVTSGMTVTPSIGRHADTDENSDEMLAVNALIASAGVGAITFGIAFSEPTSGPVRVNYMAA